MSEAAPTPAPAPGPAPAAPAPAPAPAGAPAPAPATALGAGGGAPAPSPAGAPAPTPAAPGPHDWLPEKHRVFGQDGKTLDLEASARKVADAYGHAEKRLGGGEAPPTKIEDYKVNVPEALAEKIKAEDLAKDEAFKGFLGKLHAAGASQKVVDAAVGEMLTRGAALRAAGPQLDAAECETQLRQADGWKSDAEYSKQVGLAFNAGKEIFGKDFDGIVGDYGNDPRLIRGLASIGKEMLEDRPAPPEAQAQIQESIDTLMASKAYLDGNDPQHAAVVAKVTALTAQQVGKRPLDSGMTMSFKTA